VGVGRAKLLLFGEHAAVYGYPAVGRSLPWSLTVTSSPAPSWELPGLDQQKSMVGALVERLEYLALEAGGPPLEPGRLKICADVPVGSGFGSSAALCAALVNLWFPDRSAADRDWLAWRGEQLFHGTPSGIDTALALREGWWALDASKSPAAASSLPDPGLVLVVGAVVRERTTKFLVADLAQRRERDPAAAKAVESLGEISASAVAAMAGRQTEALFPLVVQAREALCALGLETTALRVAIDEGLSCPGGLAGKLSGAGGGGAFFLAFETRETAQAALPRIRSRLPEATWTVEPCLV